MRFFGKSVRTPTMKPTRTILISLVIGLLGTSSKAEEAQSLLQTAIIQMERHRSIEATMTERVELYGKQLVGTGRYLEERSEEGLRLRLELMFPVGTEPCVLLQVCNGRYFWRYEKFSGPAAVSRIDTARVAQALEEKGDLPQPGKIGNWPGLGGLPRLLRGLNAAFDFQRIEETELGRLRAIRLQGSWKPERLARLLSGQNQAAKNANGSELDRLPPHVPHYVVLYLGKQHLFPCRIQYCRNVKPPGPGLPPAKDIAIVTMDLPEVTFDAPIHPREFHYDPGPLQYVEETDRFLETLGLKK